MDAIQPLRPGDPAPRFQAPTGEHPVLHFDQAAGRYVVLSFFGSLQAPQLRPAIDHIVISHRQWFDEINACFFGVSMDPADAQKGLLRENVPGIRYFKDFDGDISKLYGVIRPNPDGGEKRIYMPVTLILDPLLRVLAVIPIDLNHNRIFDRVIADLKQMSQHPGLSQHAPILMVPQIFESEFCAHLIAQFESGGGEISGVMEDVGGKTSEIRDDDVKRRRDFSISNGPLQQEIFVRLSRRLFPMIQQAFQFSATNVERYMVACYDGENGGFFAAHRDDTTMATAHRRFAVTINLNSGYEGGDLVFPEFGLKAYRPPPGGALVFSCSLLHLVTPVLHGRRFAFLPFLHDQKAEAERAKNLQFHSGDILQRN